MNPATPLITIDRRPCRSDRRAHIGADSDQTKAEKEKVSAMVQSGRRSERPSAGSTDCNPVFPPAVVSMTMNSNMKSRRAASRSEGLGAAMDRFAIFCRSWSERMSFMAVSIGLLPANENRFGLPLVAAFANGRPVPSAR